MSRDIEDAAAMVVARLGRRPIDALEAAVALEAWGGVEAPRSLALGPAIVDATRGRSQLWRKPILPRGQDHAVEDRPDYMQIIGAVAILLAIMMWIATVPTFRGESMGSLALEAMPTGLGVQWFLQSRYLQGENSMGRLRALDVPSILLILTAVGVAWAVGGDVGGLAAALVVVWSAATVLVVRGWALPAAGLFVAAGVAGALGTPTPVNVAVVVDLTFVAALVAVLTAPRTTRPPGEWGTVGVATSVGTMMGLLVAVGMSPGAVEVVASSSSMIALVIIGAMWGSFHLNKLWVVTLSSPIDQRSEVPGHSLRARMAVVINGAILRVLGVGVASLPIGLVLAWSDYGVEALVPLMAFVLAMLVVVLGSLVAGFGGGLRTAVSLVAGCLVAIGMRAFGLDVAAAGLALAGGSIVSLAVLIPPVKQIIDDPGMSVATLL
ncbi:MAG: hypothetical protein WA797_00900 [Acidimicrobiales bacterium]